MHYTELGGGLMHIAAGVIYEEFPAYFDFMLFEGRRFSLPAWV